MHQTDRVARPCGNAFYRSGLRCIPLLGITVAGGPVEPEGEWRTLAIPGVFGDCEHLVALEVRGESMIEAHIVPGDVVIVHRQSRASRGDLVVAMTPEGWCLKRFDPRGPVVALRSDNAAVPDRWFPADRVKIWGVVVGVLRKYR